MKSKRIEGFNSRHEPGSSQLLSEDDLGRLNLVNPMADEQELLARLNRHPSICIKMDAYWVPVDDDDIHFVQIRGSAYETDWDVGYYGRREETGENSLNLVSVVPEATITSAVVTRVLVKLTQLTPQISQRKGSKFSKLL